MQLLVLMHGNSHKISTRNKGSTEKELSSSMLWSTKWYPKRIYIIHLSNFCTCCYLISEHAVNSLLTPTFHENPKALVAAALARQQFHKRQKHLSVVRKSLKLLRKKPKSKSEVEEFFENYSEPDFARAGFVATKDVFVTNDMLFNHPVSMVEQQFRKQGLPVKIDNGKIVLQDDKKEHRLCKKGETLSPEKCKLLMHFGIKLSEFKVKLVCHWSDGEFELLN